MDEPFKQVVRITKAEYSEELDAILIEGESDEGPFKNKIDSGCFSFGNKDKAEEMRKTAQLMVGKRLSVLC